MPLVRQSSWIRYGMATLIWEGQLCPFSLYSDPSATTLLRRAKDQYERTQVAEKDIGRALQTTLLRNLSGGLIGQQWSVR